MNPQDYQQQPPQTEAPAQDPTPKHHMNNPLSVMQPGELTICEIKRHPIGLLGIYVMSGALLVVLAALAFVIVPNSLSSESRGQTVGVAGLLFFLAAAIILIFVYIANKVYWGNSWVVTSDSITQMTQTSLFHKQASQLSLGNLEDVTSEKNGILANTFNFGVLRAETAGERSKFVFIYCPTPDYYAQKILAAREQFEQVHHGGKQAPSYYTAPTDGRDAPSGQNDRENSSEQAQYSGLSSDQAGAVPGQPPQPGDLPSVPTSQTSANNMPAVPPSQSNPYVDQAQPPAYDPGAYRPLYPDTPPTFNHDSEPDDPR